MDGVSFERFDEVADGAVLQRTSAWLRARGIVLPTFAALADPAGIEPIRTAGADPNAAVAANLWRVHWHNDLSGGFVDVPDHVVLPPALTGVDSPIVVALGDRFPMIGAHKVMAAYACLAPRLAAGRFDPTTQRAVWPSTGNYARGGVAISRIMGCRGVAVLPTGMSQERFDWLDAWVVDPDDVVRTPGTESNVKEIYDACRELAGDPANVVINQFSELANHLAHYEITGRALARLFETVAAERPGLRLAAFVAATGSSGTMGAGDRLKEAYGARIVAVEALECPTMLENGYGEHNIQGIGDKHIPLIHNVMNTDVVCAVSDRATDELDVLFNTDAGRDHLLDRLKVPVGTVAQLGHFGLSSICNLVAAVKTARLLRLGPDDAIVTVATDGAGLYASERAKTVAARFGGAFGAMEGAAVHARHIGAASTDHMIDCTDADRTRIFNLGYYTWVEQQGVAVDDFEARRHQSFWRDQRALLRRWDELITDLDDRVARAS
jgi:cysteine synthase A